MDLAKLVHTLEHQSLYMSSVASLASSDPYEGQHADFGVAELARLRDSSIAEQRVALGFSGDISDELVRHTVEVVTQESYSSTFYFVNCWHINEFESDAMWRLYSLQGQGMAIQSTYDRICRSFHIDPRGLSRCCPIPGLRVSWYFKRQLISGCVLKAEELRPRM